MNMRSLSALLVALSLALAPQARAQQLLSGEEQDLANAAFATQLGSGVYSVSGRTLQIYRLPFDYTVRDTSPSKFGIELTLPVTLGFYDFELRDVAEEGLPTGIDSLSLVPGVTLRFELQPEWMLEAYAEAGLMRAADIETDATVYSGGLRSLYDFGGAGFDWTLRNDITYAGFNFHGDGGSAHFTRLQSGLTARRSFTRESRIDYLVYVVNDVFLQQPQGPIDGSERGGSTVQFELGVTLGPSTPTRLWGIPVPRLGLGYRFGPDLQVWRVVLGSPF